LGTAEVVTVGFSNSDGPCIGDREGHGASTGYFDLASKSFVLQTLLCDYGFCTDNTDKVCPGLFVPSQFGYSTKKSSSPTMDIKIDSRSLSTALAVNMGMLNVSDLIMISRDDKFAALVKQMVNSNSLTAEQAKYIKPFFDHKFIPMEPIYCIVDHSDVLPVSLDGLTDPGDIFGDDRVFASDDSSGNVSASDDFSISFAPPLPSKSQVIYAYLSMVR